MLPNFLIIGTAKAATTWLAKCLMEHPDVFIPEIKEIYFFTDHFDKGLPWYEAWFNDWNGEKAVGEATPGYIGHPDAPGLIKETLGKDIKLIASLRHPVDRAYSAFWMHLSHGRLPSDADFKTVFYEGVGKFDIRETGFYYKRLRRYLDYFPPENIRTLIYEETKQNPLTAVQNCLQFIEVDSTFEPQILNKKVNNAMTVSAFQNQVLWLRQALKKLPPGVEKSIAALGRRAYDYLPQERAYEPLSNELRQEFFKDYKDDIAALENLLQRDLSVWYSA